MSEASSQPFDRRRSLLAPRISKIDLAFAKRTRTRERVDFEVCIATYNLPSSFMGANPTTYVNTGNFGRVASKVRARFGREWQNRGRFIW